jgi:hypothetical protein
MPEVLCGHARLTPNRVLKNYFGTAKLRWPARLGRDENTLQDAQKARPARPQPMKAPEA